MTFKLAVKFDLVCGFLRCGILMDTSDVDLKVCMLNEIHTYKKDYKTQITQYSPREVEVQLYPSFRRKNERSFE